MGKPIHKYVNDLGIAAYLLLHGFVVIGKKGPSIYFECQDEAELAEFERLDMEYQPPNEFCVFDSCLMWLKKFSERVPPDFKEDENHKVVENLGMAAYVKMQECIREKPKRLGAKVIGKKGRYVYFWHPSDKREDITRICYQYLPSQFKQFDSNLGALKQIGEYMPPK